MRVTVLFIVAAMFVSMSMASASRRPGTSEKQIRFSGGSITPSSYRSPGRLHKIVVPSDDSETLAQVFADGAVELSDYGSFKLLALNDNAMFDAEQKLGGKQDGTDPATNQLRVRDDLNVLMLRSGALDTTSDDTPGTFVGIGSAKEGSAEFQPADSSKYDAAQLRLIQFVGPIKREWLDELEASGFTRVAYISNNGYLVRGDSAARDRFIGRHRVALARGEGFLQWEGPYLTEYKTHPALSQATAARSGEITVAIQLALPHNQTRDQEYPEVKQARALASSVMVDAYPVLNFTNLRMKIDASKITELAALPSVVNIEPWNPPQLFDERADQIIAGELTSDRTAPKGPGYAAWLAARGFSSPFGFAIDVSDTGIDRGVITADKLHPDFLDSNKQSRVVYARDYTSELDPGDIPGHGTINMSIAAGSNVSSDKDMRDASGFNYGLGVAPFALLGSSKIFQSSGNFDLIDPYTKLVSEAYRDGARISSNSWGDISNSYSIDSQEYDTRVRDAAPSQPGNQEMAICFAAGNAGSVKAVSNPSTAKNVISVAASENSRKDGTDGCGVTNSDADNAMDIAYFSSGGPLDDGRMKPDIAAPGSHIEGAASQNAMFDGSAVCGESFVTKPYFPSGQTLYTWSSGTSHSTPHVAGAAALVRQFLINRGEAPTAALIKALLLDTTTYMTGDRANGDLPQARQGWGLLNLGRVFDATPKFFVNQTTTFTASGQEFVLTGEVKDPTQPFRVMLAWTDAPGFSGAAPWVNDLDLEVTINGQVYRGNNFIGQVSQPGGDPDTKNNVEAVWLPAGTVGTFVVRVRASNIAGDGVPGNGNPTDQDFALVVYNGEKKDAPVLGISGLTLSRHGGGVPRPGDEVDVKIKVVNLSPVTFIGGQGRLSTTTPQIGMTINLSDFPSIAPGQMAESSGTFVFGITSTVPCGTTISFVLDVTSQGLVSRIPFTVMIGTPQPTQFFSDDIESGDSKWTHGSGIAKKKSRVDTWTISTRRVHSGTSSWFTPDPGSQITDAHLDTSPIQLPADGRNIQLVFYHTFEFERGTFDGGVLEISTGADFEDLGGKIIKGRYNSTIRDFTSNPLAGRPGWVEGRLGTFQQVIVDLSSYAGKTVTIRFRIGTDANGKGLGWYIDDVSLRGDRVSCASVELVQ